MKNYLKITIIIFLSTGIFFSLGLFALKIIFEKNDNDELVILGPDNKDIFTIPKDVGGKKVPNLDIEILNNKKALVTKEKLRLPPAEPELLPLDVIEEKINNKTKNTKELKNNIIKDSEKKVLSSQGFRTVPQIYNELGEHIGGFTDLREYFENGEYLI